jgi:hypothetical protein
MHSPGSAFDGRPEDLNDSDIVLAALWNLHREAADYGLPVGSSSGIRFSESEPVCAVPISARR